MKIFIKVVTNDYIASTSSQETDTSILTFGFYVRYQLTFLHWRSTPSAYIGKPVFQCEKWNFFQVKKFRSYCPHFSAGKQFDIYCRSLAKQLNFESSRLSNEITNHSFRGKDTKNVDHVFLVSIHSVSFPYEQLSQYNFEPATSENHLPLLTSEPPGKTSNSIESIVYHLKVLPLWIVVQSVTFCTFGVILLNKYKNDIFALLPQYWPKG